MTFLRRENPRYEDLKSRQPCSSSQGARPQACSLLLSWQGAGCRRSALQQFYWAAACFWCPQEGKANLFVRGPDHRNCKNCDLGWITLMMVEMCMLQLYLLPGELTAHKTPLAVSDFPFHWRHKNVCGKIQSHKVKRHKSSQPVPSHYHCSSRLPQAAGQMWALWLAVRESSPHRKQLQGWRPGQIKSWLPKLP